MYIILIQCSTINLCLAQTLILKLAEMKNMAFELQAEICLGIAELYKNANVLAIEIKLDKNEIICTFNRRCYYEALGYFKVSNSLADKFAQSGIGFGQQISFMQMASTMLFEGNKDIVMFIKKEINIWKY